MSSLKNKIVTVFGGTGFVGRHVVSALIREGAVVRVVSRYKSACYNLRTGALVGQMVPVVVDYNDDKSLRAALKGADFSLNLIGILAESSHQSFEDIHVKRAEAIAKAAAKEKIKHHVHTSALGADEESQSKYQQSKARGEKAVLKAFSSVTLLRPSIIFGEGDGFFSRFAKMSRLLPVLPLIGGGKTRFQPVFVGDVVSAIMMAFEYYAEAPAHFKGKVIECAGPQVYSFKELLNYIQHEIGTDKPLFPLSFGLAKCQGWFMEKLPGKILTVDQVVSLKSDNVETGEHLTLEDIDIIPTPMEVIVSDYLEAYRTGGQFASQRRA
mgnify:CR=1 FL=1